MSGWFDDAARRAAADSTRPQISRRTMLKRGAVVAGVAWTAPVLMATPAAATSLSNCNLLGGTMCPTGSTKCCSGATPVCTQAPPIGGAGAYSCVASGFVPKGNSCTGSGTTCNTAANAKCSPSSVCGGAGAACTADAQCFTTCKTHQGTCN